VVYINTNSLTAEREKEEINKTGI